MDYLDLPKEVTKKDQKDDFMMSGIFVTFGLIAIIGFLVYLFTIQVHAKNCQPTFDAKGNPTNSCPPPKGVPTPSVAQPGQIQFINLGPKKIPELEGN